LPCQVRPMAKIDIHQVAAIDREAFPTMWPPVNFQHELNNRLAHYLVVCNGDQAINASQLRPFQSPLPKRTFLGIKWPFVSKNVSDVADPPTSEQQIAGFVGLWIMLDEAHIINIAVRETYRGQGIGELLLISSIDTATKLAAGVVTLEVRASNSVAQNLYSKYGFKQAGVRRGYYTDNREDALIMTTDNITTDSFKKNFQGLKETLCKRLNCLEYRLA
jgi:[ribosomal protein S18]-alanine N-acetyltransferase